MRFAVCLPRLPGHVHSHAFDEVAESVHFGLLALGHESVMLQGSTAHILYRAAKAGARIVLFGPHLIGGELDRFPEGTILYNLDQTDAPWVPDLAKLFQGFTLWDYSARNVAFWQGRGIAAVHVPIGVVPQLSRIKLAAEEDKDIDVLFYGWLNDRRRAALDSCRRQGLVVQVLTSTYGPERDAFIARARVVLNVHFYLPGIFEVARVFYLLANQVCVVSESSVEDQDYAGRIVIAPYEDLGKACALFARNRAARDAVAQKGREYITTLDETRFLKRAISSP